MHFILCRDSSDPQSELCDTTDTHQPPTSTCRFVPNKFQQAKTSLMHYHWIDSISSFCDENTHNKHAPNKQNLYCWFKSVKQVIGESYDAQMLSDSHENLGRPVKFNIKQAIRNPLLYVLLDVGASMARKNSKMY